MCGSCTSSWAATAGEEVEALLFVGTGMRVVLVRLKDRHMAGAEFQDAAVSLFCDDRHDRWMDRQAQPSTC